MNKEPVPIVGRFRTCIEMAKGAHLLHKNVLDIGCSNGLLSTYLMSEKPKKYVGIDPSDEAILKANRLNSKAKFVKSSAGKLPFKDKSFDVVFMFDVIEHVPVGTEKIAVGEAFRVLKKKGILLLSTPNNNFFTNMLDPAWYFGHRHYEPKEIGNLLESEGFKVKKTEVKGGLWFSIYLIWLYFMKWVLNKKEPRNSFLELMDDKQFEELGIHTIFITAVKL